ncbi:hypothetical protein ACFL59_16590 [Planctomycetota bacterium]
MTAHCKGHDRFAIRLVDDRGELLWHDSERFYGTCRLVVFDFGADEQDELVLLRAEHGRLRVMVFAARTDRDPALGQDSGREEDRPRQEDDRAAQISWEKQFGEDLFNFQFPEPTPADSWTMVNGVLQGRAGGDLGMGIGAIAGVGSSDWRDYLLKVDYKVVKGRFKIGVRFNKRLGAFVMCEPEVDCNGGWHTVTLSVRGHDFDSIQEILSDGGTRAVEFDRHDSMQGGICFVLDPHGEVFFRNLGVNVITRGD